MRGANQFHEITGAVFDSLAQIALMRGGYEDAGDYLRQAGDAYGNYGAQTSQWYEWSIRVLEAKLAARRGATDEALRLASEIVTFPTMVRRALVPYIASLRGDTQSQGSGGIREGSQGGPRAEKPLSRRTRLPQWNLPHVSLAARTGAPSAFADCVAGGG